MLERYLEIINQLLDDSANNSYTAICKKFSANTAKWNGLESNKFYTTYDGDDWIETPDNSHNGIDVSWAFHLSDEKIDKLATDTLYDIITSELENVDEDENAINFIIDKVNSIKYGIPSVNDIVSRFTITPLQNSSNNVLAVATVTFYDTLTVNSITIREAQSGNLYVKMPQKLTLQGNYIDVIHPLNSESRKIINAILIDAYCTGRLRQEHSSDIPKISASAIPNISARNSVKYEIGKYGNNLARLDVIVNDMVVHNCKIINSKDNKPLLTLPTYKDKNGVYHSIMTPTSPERFKLLNQAALNEYNTEYSFKKCDEAQLSAIKESGIKCSSNKNAQGDIFVKFKTSDLQKVNSVLSSVAPIHK